MYPIHYLYDLPMCCNAHFVENTPYTSALHYPITPGTKIWESSAHLPRGPLKLSYRNTGDEPFKIYMDAFNIALTADPHSNGEISLGSPSTLGITSTPLRINCLARDYTVRLSDNCSGFVNILLDRPARRRRERTLPMD